MPKQKQVTIKAKFIGKDRSLGYRENRSYKLIAVLNPEIKVFKYDYLKFIPFVYIISKIVSKNIPELVIMRQNRNLSSHNWGYCPYTTKKAFLSNWIVKKGNLWK